MNIPDEYWTTEVPNECGPYMMRIDNGEYVADSVVKVIGFHWEAGEPRKIVIAGGDITPRPVPRGAKFCRLAPAAEVDRLKAENEKLRNALDGMLHLCEHDLGMDESSPYIEWAQAALEGRAE